LSAMLKDAGQAAAAAAEDDAGDAGASR
jgi:hypothetical protein